MKTLTVFFLLCHEAMGLHWCKETKEIHAVRKRATETLALARTLEEQGVRAYLEHEQDGDPLIFVEDTLYNRRVVLKTPGTERIHFVPIKPKIVLIPESYKGAIVFETQRSVYKRPIDDPLIRLLLQC
jgi:hypothetical protein